MTRTAVVICPGRGTYNKSELGYFARHHQDRSVFLAMLDQYRIDNGQISISDLDGAAHYSPSIHTRGDNASPLIYACSVADFLTIDREAFEIVAVTGNSMGWYVALACSGVLTDIDGMSVVNTMGTLMQKHAAGGQTVYPLVDADWHPVPGRRDALMGLMRSIGERDEHVLSLSIDLGGMLVFAGNEAGLNALESELERVDDQYPMRLNNHAAFHSDLMEEVAQLGQGALPTGLFQQPTIPLVDGRGGIWYPGACDADLLRDYTLGYQVTETYEFSRAIEVAVREFAPDCLIVTGPGNTLGGSVAQCLVDMEWQGLSGKEGFLSRQALNPLLLSMGLDDQRALVCGESDESVEHSVVGDPE